MSARNNRKSRASLQPYFFDPREISPITNASKVRQYALRHQNHERPKDNVQEQSEVLEAAAILLSIYHSDSRPPDVSASEHTESTFTELTTGSQAERLLSAPQLGSVSSQQVQNSRLDSEHLPVRVSPPSNVALHRYQHDHSTSPVKTAPFQHGHCTGRSDDDARYFQHPTLAALRSSPAKYRHGTSPSPQEADDVSDTTELMSDEEIDSATPRPRAGLLQDYVLPVPPLNSSQRLRSPCSSPTRPARSRVHFHQDLTSSHADPGREEALVTPELTSPHSPSSNSNEAPRTPKQTTKVPGTSITDSAASLDAFVLEAREAMSHRRTESLESYLGRARQSFAEIRKDDENELMWTNEVMDVTSMDQQNVKYDTSQAVAYSSDLEEGEILDTARAKRYHCSQQH